MHTRHKIILLPINNLDALRILIFFIMHLAKSLIRYPFSRPSHIDASYEKIAISLYPYNRLSERLQTPDIHWAYSVQSHNYATAMHLSLPCEPGEDYLYIPAPLTFVLFSYQHKFLSKSNKCHKTLPWPYHILHGITMFISGNSIVMTIRLLRYFILSKKYYM